MDDIYSVDKLFCTLCYHDLNHRLYKICSHPVIPVPLCILCHDDAAQFDKENFDICAWCGDGGDLVCCSNNDEENGCFKSFCRECISNNLGTQILREIDESDIWLCLACDPSQVESFQTALNYGITQSIFGEAFQLEVNSSISSDEISDTSDGQVAIERLTQVVEECNVASDMLNRELEKRKEIKLEIMSTTDPLTQNININDMVDEEYALYAKYWQHHMDILSREEADLFEQVSFLGLDPRSLAVYKDVTQRVTVKDPSPEDMYLLADKNFEQMKSKRRAEVKEKTGCSVTTRLFNTVSYVEDVQEEVDDTESGRLSTYIDLAANDEIVLRCASLADVKPALYPPSFERILPTSVIKALYYTSGDEHQGIISKFNVPRHVVLVVAGAKEPGFPRSTNYWSFASTVHPSVRKALFHAPSVVDQAVLCAHYGLSEEMCSVTDFGNAEDICGIFNERKRLEAVQTKGDKLSKSRSSKVNGVNGLDSLSGDWNDDEDCEDDDEHRGNPLGEVNPNILNELARREEQENQVQQTKLMKETRQQSDTKLAKRLSRFLTAPRQSDDKDDEQEIRVQRELDMTDRTVVPVKRNKSSRIKDPRVGKNRQHSESIRSEVNGGLSASSQRINKPVVSLIPSVSPVSNAPETNTIQLLPTTVIKSAIGEIGNQDSSDEDEDGGVFVQRSLAAKSKGRNKSARETVDLTMSSDEENGGIAEGSDHSDNKSSTDNFSSGDDGERICYKRIRKPKVDLLPRRSARNAPTQLDESDSGSDSSTHFTSSDGDNDVDNDGDHLVVEESDHAVEVDEIDSDMITETAVCNDEGIVDDDDVVFVGTSSNNAVTNGDSVSKSSLNWLKAPSSCSKSATMLQSKSASKLPVTHNKGPVVASGAGSGRKGGLPDFMVSNANNSYDLGAIARHAVSYKSQSKLTDEQLIQRYFSSNNDTNAHALVLNPNGPSRSNPVAVVSEMVPNLKEHQIEGLQFIWRNVMETSYSQLTREKGGNKKDNGCILAHCMGLGKTFTIVAFVVTMLTNPAVASIVDSYQPPEEPLTVAEMKDRKQDTSGMKVDTGTTSMATSSLISRIRPPKRLIQSVLIIVPLVTIENWAAEFRKWTPVALQSHSRVMYIDASLNAKTKLEMLRKWHVEGGVMIMGYTMLRLMTTATKAKGTVPITGMVNIDSSKTDLTLSAYNQRNAKSDKGIVSEEVAAACRYLLDPGPDIVVADEAHQLSNEKSQISVAFNRMRTKRRIALTGSPLQNNLVEYWCMINWVKHYHLFSLPRFKELFVNPIAAGDKADAHPREVKEMRKKVHVLNKKLSTIVNRKDFSILASSLKMKRQYVLVVRMTSFQQFLYRTFLAKLMVVSGSVKVKLFKTYQCFLRLWNHPCCTVAQTIFARHQLQQEEAKQRHSVALSGAKSKKKQNVSTTSMIQPTLNTMVKELSVTYNYFSRHSDRLLTELQQSTRAVEEALLKPSAGGIEDLDNLCDDEGNGDFIDDNYEEGVIDEADAGDSDCDNCLNDDAGLGVKRSLSVDIPEGHLHPIAEETEGREDVGMTQQTAKKMRHCESLDSLSTLQPPRHENEALNSFVSLAAPSESHRLRQPSPVARSRSVDTVQHHAGRNTPPVTTSSSQKLSLDWWKHVPLAADKKKKNVNGIASMDLTGDGGDEMIDDDDWIETRMSHKDLLELSNKMVTFLTLLALSVLQGDKVLVFSQSLYTLDVIEQFLKMSNWAADLLPKEIDPSVCAKQFSNWYNGSSYLRIDGKTKDRQELIDRFNKNDRFKLFMVCTKAGNMGINLYTANRVVIFDSSWNPVHDLQAISRAYRYGQKKEVFVYRLVAAGSMEEVIYKRQMLKQALAARVVDAQMPDNQASCGDLMDFDTKQQTDNEGDKAVNSVNGLVLSDTVNQDSVLVQFVDRHSSCLAYIADQEVLLADKVESHLNAEEQVLAEAEYERELEREKKMAEMAAQMHANYLQMQRERATAASLGLPFPTNNIHSSMPVYSSESALETQNNNNDEQIESQQHQTAGMMVQVAASAASAAASGIMDVTHDEAAVSATDSSKAVGTAALGTSSMDVE